MAKRIMHEIRSSTGRVAVDWDTDAHRYIVRFYRWNGRRECRRADYFTDDRADAIRTAQAMLKRLGD